MSSYQPVPRGSKAGDLDFPTYYASVSASTQNFTRFSELPTEIRFQIWQFTLPAPRVLGIQYGESCELLYSQYPPPVALHICSESRAVALKHYELAFVNRLKPHGTYFDFSRDIVQFHSTFSFQYFLPDETFPPEEMLRDFGNDLARVKFICCCVHDAGMTFFPMPYLPGLRPFKALEEITLLLPPAAKYGPDKIFVDPLSVALDRRCNPRSIEFLEYDRDEILELWKNDEFREFSIPKISVMSYICGNYRVC